MPTARIQLRSGKPESYRQAIFDAIYQTLLNILNVPEDDQFMTMTEHDASNFRYGSAFGVDRSEDTVYIQISVFNTRTPEQKKALYRDLVDRLTSNPGIRPEDIFINIYDLPLENWSVGNGEAQFV